MAERINSEISPSISSNIDKILRLEDAAMQHNTVVDWLADRIGSFVGTITFVVVQIVALGVWFALNNGLISGVRPFDPYPYNLLSMVVSVEGVLLSTFVLLLQNRLGNLSDRRDHIDLQVNLLAEQEITRLLQMVERIAEKMDLAEDDLPRAGGLARETEVEEIVSDLDRQMAGR